MVTELETLQNIEYLLEVLVGQNANNKLKLEKDSKTELKNKIFSVNEKNDY